MSIEDFKEPNHPGSRHPYGVFAFEAVELARRRPRAALALGAIGLAAVAMSWVWPALSASDTGMSRLIFILWLTAGAAVAIAIVMYLRQRRT